MVSEGTSLPHGVEFTMAGVLVLNARDGRLQKVRDYMDVFGFAQHTGRLAAPASWFNQ